MGVVVELEGIICYTTLDPDSLPILKQQRCRCISLYFDPYPEAHEVDANDGFMRHCATCNYL